VRMMPHEGLHRDGFEVVVASNVRDGLGSSQRKLLMSFFQIPTCLSQGMASLWSARCVILIPMH
jgi:hypothetical protein